MRSFSIFLLISSVLFISGCGGVNSRIKDHEQEFSGYPPEVQAQIQNGRIDRGFTEDQVYLAKGEPSDKATTKRDGKTVVIWKYSRSTPAAPPSGQSTNLSTPYGYPSFGAGPSQPTPMFYGNSSFKVEFLNGKVFNWDQEMQPQ